MDILIWIGTGVSLLGLGGLLWCILRVWRARRTGLTGADLHAVLQRVVPVNTGALLLSAFGLMLVVTGILLG